MRSRGKRQSTKIGSMTASCLLSHVRPQYDSLVTFSILSVSYLRQIFGDYIALVSPGCQHRPKCDDSIFDVRLCRERLIEILTMRKRDLSINEYLEHVAA